MTISEKAWADYITKITNLKGRARLNFLNYIEKHGIDDVNAVTDYAYALATKYGEGTAATAAEFYDAVALAQGADVPEAILADTATKGETEYAVKKALDSSGINAAADAVEALTKQAGEDTIWQNAKRDGAEMAWIPAGGGTCPFCLIVASNGWRHASEKTMRGQHATHIHAHCRCAFAVRFDGKSGVAGYNPEKLKRIYDSAPGKTSLEKANYLRRENYEKNKDEINARKRELYKLKTQKKNNG